MQHTAPEQPRPQAAPRYIPPALTPLGAWQTVTLVGSVGFNGLPGMPFPGGSDEVR
ncbi:hypothetical protein [Deinococcus multiflagellatus]|uniref:RidA family protein n=1 Tax=Deinococcus multiflagellatus TaxID=1656887 RepID=A0ABW1ZLB7_9DEIO|nr:hypothetical protein [Deinococcus multiflagellatus]MBZ9713243.1 hypothetical protein [Deinococcus multiflagellatus]